MHQRLHNFQPHAADRLLRHSHAVVAHNKNILVGRTAERDRHLAPRPIGEGVFQGVLSQFVDNQGDGRRRPRRQQQTLALGQRIFERVSEDRHLIPASNYFELAYDDLVGNEIEKVEQIFSHLSLPGWDSAKRPLERYVRGLQGYRKNQLSLDQRSCDQVWEWWRPAFESFGYDREHGDLS